MIVPSKEWPFMQAPEAIQGQEENAIMKSRRKIYSLLQAKEQESEDYNVNIISTVRLEK